MSQVTSVQVQFLRGDSLIEILAWPPLRIAFMVPSRVNVRRALREPLFGSKLILETELSIV